MLCLTHTEGVCVVDWLIGLVWENCSKINGSLRHFLWPRYHIKLDVRTVIFFPHCSQPGILSHVISLFVSLEYVNVKRKGGFIIKANS